MRPPTRPRTNPGLKDDLLVAYLDDEAVVFDPSTQQGHALNGPATAVYRGLEERLEVEGMSASMGSLVVDKALRELGSAGLLRPGSAIPRRTALKGMAALAIPTVVSLMIPTAAEAQSSVDCSVYTTSDTCNANPACLWIVLICAPKSTGGGG